MARSLFSASYAQRIPRAVVVLLRLFVGLTWIQTGWNKVATEGGWLSRMLDSVNGMRPDSYAFYGAFVDSVVIPNAALFAALVTWGELLVGVSVLLGAATRVGAGVGALLSLNYAMLQGRDLYLPGLDGTLFWEQVVLIWSAAGRAFGVDFWLQRRWPRVPLW